MKKYLLLLCTAFLGISTRACPVCEKAQPRALRGLVHGAGPDSRWDYLIVLVVAVITVLTLFYSVKWLFRPGESGATHIKHFILNND